MDLLSYITHSVEDFISGLDTNVHIFVIRMGLWLEISGIALAHVWQYVKNSSSHFIQICIMVVTIIIMHIFDAEECIDIMPDGIVVIFFIFFFLSMMFLPAIIPFWFSSKYGYQKILRRILYIVIWSLFFIQLIVA